MNIKNPPLNDLLRHFVINTLIAVIIYWQFRSFKLVLISFVSGFIIDIDHLIDYFLFYGFKWNFWAFVRGDYAKESGKLYIFLHSWEILIPLWIIWVTHNNNEVIVFIIGFIGHMLVDHRRTKYGYFLLVRMANKFNLEAVLSPQMQQKIWNEPLEVQG